jgi:hypothetical protein
MLKQKNIMKDFIGDCITCEYHYLCGGICNIITNGGRNSMDLNLFDCTLQKSQIKRLIHEAMSCLNLSEYNFMKMNNEGFSS